jgi:superoxide dismutase, Cu-Zn family
MRKHLGIAIVLATLAPAAAAAGEAGATIVDTDGRTIGEATFREGPQGVVMRLAAEGLPPGVRGMHIHEVGVCHDHDEGFMASGGHLDSVGDVPHGLLNPDGHHEGDLPNLIVHEDGSARVEIYIPDVALVAQDGRPQLTGGDGTALVIHENEDDHVNQPIGGAGDRIACGVIERAG